MEAPAALGVYDDFFRHHIAPELRWVRGGSKKLESVAELERWLEREAGLTLGESVTPSVRVTSTAAFEPANQRVRASRAPAPARKSRR
jgi:hypothetical protein